MNENINSSNTQHDINKQLVSFIEKQNDLIFSLRKRLFQLERTQNKDAKILCAMSIGICVVMILMCFQFGGFKW